MHYVKHQLVSYAFIPTAILWRGAVAIAKSCRLLSKHCEDLASSLWKLTGVCSEGSGSSHFNFVDNYWLQCRNVRQGQIDVERQGSRPLIMVFASIVCGGRENRNKLTCSVFLLNVKRKSEYVNILRLNFNDRYGIALSWKSRSNLQASFCYHSYLNRKLSLAGGEVLTLLYAGHQ